MTSVMLAKILGILMSVFGLSLLINHEKFRAIIGELLQYKLLHIITSIALVICGSYLVIVHNVWAHSWHVMITLFAWALLLGGAVRLLFPAFWISLIKAHKDTISLSLVGLMVFLFGGLMVYHGFFV